MGTVHFLTSCSPEVRDEFDLALATLHSFGYGKSAQLFAQVLSTDPSCSMAEWGIAMSHYRQLWDPPTKDDLRIGLQAAQEGWSMGSKTQRERDYLGAIQGFYQNAGSESHSIRAKRVPVCDAVAAQPVSAGQRSCHLLCPVFDCECIRSTIRLMQIKRRRQKFSNRSSFSSRNIRASRTTSSMPTITRCWLRWL